MGSMLNVSGLKPTTSDPFQVYNYKEIRMVGRFEREYIVSVMARQIVHPEGFFFVDNDLIDVGKDGDYLVFFSETKKHVFKRSVFEASFSEIEGMDGMGWWKDTASCYSTRFGSGAGGFVPGSGSTGVTVNSMDDLTRMFRYKF